MMTRWGRRKAKGSCCYPEERRTPTRQPRGPSTTKTSPSPRTHIRQDLKAAIMTCLG
ncbi:unnamed protein product, partial [Ectocarpus sp. 6 AP-2014]